MDNIKAYTQVCDSKNNIVWKKNCLIVFGHVFTIDPPCKYRKFGYIQEYIVQIGDIMHLIRTCSFSDDL